MRCDGNYKLAKRIVSRSEPDKKPDRIYSVVMGFCGVDGALLKVVSPRRTEDWPDLALELRELHQEMKQNRERAGLTSEQVAPVGHSTDQYAKHRCRLQSFYRNMYGASKL